MENNRLQSLWVGDSRPYQLSSLSYVLARLEMRHNRVLGVVIPTNAYLLFKDAAFSPPPNLHACILVVAVFPFGQCLGERFSPLSTFFSLVNSGTFRDAPHLRFRCGNPTNARLTF